MKHYFVFLVCIMRAKFTESLLESSVNLSYNEDYFFDIPKECLVALDSFSEVASIFTKCSIKYARPIKLCENCIDSYVNFTLKYGELLTTVANGTSCKSIFISHDRLDVVLQYHDSILAVWNKGNCNACFDWNQTTPLLSNETQNFNKMFDVTWNCIRDNSNGNGNYSEQVCENCMVYYLQLDDYYKSLSVDAIGVDSVCIDIVDSMNTTRSIWSKGLNCCKLRRSPEIVFLACSGIISILPLLYYIAVRYCGPIRDLPNVLKQSRFKQRFLKRGNTSIN